MWLIMDELNITSQLIEMINQKDRLIAELVQAITKIQVSQPVPPVPYEQMPLYVPEEEQDIDYLLKNRMIDTKEAEEMLQNLDFANTEITIDG